MVPPERLKLRVMGYTAFRALTTLGSVRPTRESNAMRRQAALRLHPALTAMLNGLGDTEFGDEFRQNAVTLSTQLLTQPRPDPGQALVPHRWMLERASGDGLPLTAAGYLKPADARELAELLPEMRDYPWAGTREIDAHPVLAFREYLRDIKLVRRYKGTLRLTPLGRECLADPERLWRHCADTLIGDPAIFGGHCSVTLAVYAATADRTIRPQRIARVLSAHGWRHSGGEPLGDRDVYPVWNELWARLSAVGTPDPEAGRGEFLPRIPSAAARALIRDALFEVVPDPDVDPDEAEAGAAFRRGAYRPIR